MPKQQRSTPKKVRAASTAPPLERSEVETAVWKIVLSFEQEAADAARRAVKAEFNRGKLGRDWRLVDGILFDAIDEAEILPDYWRAVDADK